LWYIETELGSELDLERIARFGGLSRFGMARAFAIGTGWPVMRYVRARRLSEAARLLASGAPDILDVALEIGYGSHEAFTRAFREQFGVTPERVRAQRTVDGLALMEPVNMKQAKLIDRK